MKQDHNNLYYHLLLITRGRSKILNADIVNKAKEVFEQDCEPYGMKLTKDIYEDDFLHLVYLGDHYKNDGFRQKLQDARIRSATPRLKTGACKSEKHRCK